MNGFDLDDIERLLAAATPGEWIACGWGDGSTPDGLANIFNHDAEVLLMECLPVDDAALIVALHNSAPAMLTEIRELRAENAQIVAWLRTQWRTDMGEIECLDIADAIEQGDFRNG